jgi:hypothetical protein
VLDGKSGDFRLVESHLRELGPRHYCATNLSLDSPSRFSLIATAPPVIVGSCAASAHLSTPVSELGRPSISVLIRVTWEVEIHQAASVRITVCYPTSVHLSGESPPTVWRALPTASPGPDDKSASGFLPHPLRVIRQGLELVVRQTATTCELLSQSFSSFTVLVQLVRGKVLPRDFKLVEQEFVSAVAATYHREKSCIVPKR